MELQHTEQNCLWISVVVCVCVCERERESREGGGGGLSSSALENTYRVRDDIIGLFSEFLGFY